MNEMVMARLIAEEVVNIMIDRGIISVRGGNTGYDPDRRIEPADMMTLYGQLMKLSVEASCIILLEIQC